MKCNFSLCLRGPIDAVFILRRMHEEYHAKGKTLYVCFVDLRIDRVLRKVLEWAVKKEDQKFWLDQ